MKELIGRVAAFDPAAGDNLRVVSYFDALVEGRAGLDAFVRGAAVLTGCPAGLVDPDHRIGIRVTPDGHRQPLRGSDPSRWPHRGLGEDSAAMVWIERDGPAGPNDAMVLERFRSGARVGIDRTRGGVPLDDRTAVELLLDPAATAAARRRAATQLRIPADRPARLLARPSEGEGVRLPPRTARLDAHADSVLAALEAEPGSIDADRPGRVGVGPWLPLDELADSWPRALCALRLTSRLRPVIGYDTEGALIDLLIAADPARIRHPDVERVAKAADGQDSALDTLDAVLISGTLRGAAEILGIHHSTLQSRIAALERTVGFPLADTAGRQRLRVALAVHRLTMYGR